MSEKLIPESEANKETDVFVGMWRPPWETGWFANTNAVVVGKSGATFWSRDQAHRAWLAGEFDTALYRRVIENARND